MSGPSRFRQMAFMHRRAGGASASPSSARGVPRDHQFLVGRDHPGRHAAAGAEMRGPLARVGVAIELDAEPRRGLADPLADLRRVLADAGGEHQPVDAAAAPRRARRSPSRRGRRNSRPPAAPPGSRLAEQIAHVVADPGDAEQPRLLVEHRLDLLRRQPEPLKEVEDDAGIERARAACPCTGRRAR